MIRKENQQYFEMGYALMSGIVVDEQLKNQLQAVLTEAKEKIKRLITENPSHYLLTHSSLVYPRGKQTSFNYQEPPRMFDLDLYARMGLVERALSMQEVEHLFVSDKSITLDDMKAYAQRAIEDEWDAERR